MPYLFEKLIECEQVMYQDRVPLLAAIMKSVSANKTMITISREHGSVHFGKTAIYSGVSFLHSVSSSNKKVFRLEKTAQITFTSLQTLNKTAYVNVFTFSLQGEDGERGITWEGAQLF